MRDELPQLERIYVIDELDGDLPNGVLPAESLMQHGAADLDDLAPRTSPDDLATLIYTSGTTGPPKGVMLSQYNIVYTNTILIETIEVPDIAGWKVVSYLPMAHIAERMVSHYNTLMEGTEVYCCPNFNDLSSYLRDVRPQLLFGVPRVYEKIHAGVNAALAADLDKQRQFDDGVALATEIKRAQIAGIDTQDQRDMGLPRRRGILDRPSADRARPAPHGDQRRGADPRRDPRVVQRDRRAALRDLRHVRVVRPDDVLTEAQQAGLRRAGDPGCEVQIAEDGEVVCRGGNVFVGYSNQPRRPARRSSTDGSTPATSG